MNLFDLPTDLPPRYIYTLTCEFRLEAWIFVYLLKCDKGSFRVRGSQTYDGTVWCTVDLSRTKGIGWKHLTDLDGVNLREYHNDVEFGQHAVIFHKLARLADKMWRWT